MLVTLVRRGALFVLLGATASPAALAQTAVSGTVRDDRNAPLPGAAVAVRGSRIGVMANDDGRYRLVIPPELAGSDSVMLIARRVGFDAVTKRVVAAGTSVTVDFVLKLIGDRYTPEEIVKEYPELELEDIHQATQYGATLSK